MTLRIETHNKVQSGAAATLSKLTGATVRTATVYTINKAFNEEQQKRIADCLHNPVSQTTYVLAEDTKTPPDYGTFSFALEQGFQPGVTDNVATTTKQIIEDALGVTFEEEEGVYTATLYLVDGDEAAVQTLKQKLVNPLIQRSTVKTAQEVQKQGGMPIEVPKVTLHTTPTIDTVDLNVNNEELTRIGKQGILNADGSRRGPLGLSLPDMQAIAIYFKTLSRNPTDVELETLAQTWSEHCKHTIFASKMDEIEDGIFKHFIRRATLDIQKHKGKDDICVSLFKDNAGAIAFDDDYIICDKVETHNTPSALDPFGGSITGIVGVNRDCMGFGKGAKPILNRYGFCLANPKTDDTTLYRGKNKTNPMLGAGAIMDGVIEGVEVGGNCSGIPTPQGFLYFDKRYRGKPLVFCGTVGLMPRTVAGTPGHVKGAKPGDMIVMAGGRVGKDGIHGATFSSEGLDEGSPVTAVQIGDPITQKKMSDALIKEARDKGLYNSITDNGAGGLSSSIGEMAEESGGCQVWLDKVPLKYPGLHPWEIWVSESQERMTLATPPAKVDDLLALLARHHVEATVIGTFTDDGTVRLTYGDEQAMNMPLDFLHDGQPKRTLHTETMPHDQTEPELAEPQDYAQTLCDVLADANVCSRRFISTQYDHEVQATSVLKPLQGPGQVNGEASIIKPLPHSQKGVITSQAVFPAYGDIDTYHMAAAAIDAAVRHIVCAGGTISHTALLDNFCWCSSNDPERLGQLRRAAEACYDYATKYGTPFISGKDSMFNDFSGFDAAGEAVKISAPPTLLISALGVLGDVQNTLSLDVKAPEDLVYIIGETRNELGGSIYYAQNGHVGSYVPKTDTVQNMKTYTAFAQASARGLVASAYGVGLGGLGAALAKKAIAGSFGLRINMANVPAPREVVRDDALLFSESTGRIVCSVSPANAQMFEDIMMHTNYACLGTVCEEPTLHINTFDTDKAVTLPLEDAKQAYFSTFGGQA